MAAVLFLIVSLTKKLGKGIKSLSLPAKIMLGVTALLALIVKSEVCRGLIALSIVIGLSYYNNVLGVLAVGVLLFGYFKKGLWKLVTAIFIFCAVIQLANGTGFGIALAILVLAATVYTKRSYKSVKKSMAKI